MPHTTPLWRPYRPSSFGSAMELHVHRDRVRPVQRHRKFSARARHRVAVQSDGHAVGVARGVFRGISNLKVQPNLRQSGQISLSCLLFRCLPEDSSKSIFMPLRSCSKFLTTFLKSRSNLSIRIRLECLQHGLETPGATFVIPITTWNRWSFETNKRNINI